MKRAIVFLLFSLFSTALQAAGPEIPRKAGDFAIQTAPKKYIWLRDYAGKTIVLAFVLTDCVHCQFTSGLLSGIRRDYAAQGVQVVESAINPMSALYIPAFVSKLKLTFPVGYDEQSYAAKFLGYPERDPMFMPQIVFIDRNGTIRAQLGGDDPTLADAVQDKTLRETLDRVIKEGQTAAVRPSAPKE